MSRLSRPGKKDVGDLVISQDILELVPMLVIVVVFVNGYSAVNSSTVDPNRKEQFLLHYLVDSFNKLQT